MGKIKAAIQSVVNLDGWANMTTWLGRKGKDRITSVKFCTPNVLSASELMAIYRGSGMGKRGVDLPASEMVRQWFTIQGDDEGRILARLEEIDAKNKILTLVKWARLFGGAIAVLGIDDGRELDQPVNENDIRDLEFIHVFDKEEVSSNSLDLYQDPNDAKFQQIEFYTVNSSRTGRTFKVHESRILRLDGEEVPNQLITTTEGWGDSVIQAAYNELRNVGGAYNSTASIVEDFIQTVLKVNNLSQLMASGQDKLVMKRLELIDTSRSVANTLLLDSLDEYSKQASSVSGLNELLKEFCLALCMAFGVPYTIFMGQSPGGLQATGDADIRMFYDKIRCKQEDWLRPALEKLIRYLMIAKNGPLGGAEPANWKICFNPLWQMTETETANYRKIIADTDAVNIGAGIVDPVEVRASRFGTGVYSAETVIDVSLDIDPPTAEENQKPEDEKPKDSSRDG